MDKRARYLLDSDPKTAKARDVDDATVRFKYLLGLTDLFRHFINLNALHDPHFKQMVRQVDANLAAGGGGSTRAAATPARAGRRKHRRKTEKEEDAELLQEEHAELEEHHDPATVLTELPLFVQLGTLREYQVQGLNWLILLYENRLSGILADEMGLGKTLQTIAFLGYLRHVRRVEGPFIVIVPKSTLDNWRREFAKWTPEVDAVVLQGDRDARRRVIEERLLTAQFDVLITSFEMVIREKLQLKKFRWQYLIVDEAHRIKNEASTLLQIIRLFYLKNRLLITGTPLQNNLHELWALLNFLLPDVFGEAAVFDRWFEGEATEGPDADSEGPDADIADAAAADATAADTARGDRLVHQLHQILQPFLLRRVKADVEKSLLPKIETNVYIGMSDMQLRWYRKLLEKDIDAVNGVVGKREGKTRLLNIVMQLRKCCNHPYLFDGAEPGPPFTTDEHLVFNSGKMIILDKMLAKFRADGSRVLIFLQMLRLLDILEDYCYLRDYEYSRIDGLTSHEDRIEAIDHYNAPHLDKFIFLLTTRAGGLGINLTTADIVVLFDLDWNPQADLQAMDRAHRIGQKKQVRVFRFVTEFAIEEKVLERAAQKLRLDQLVIQQGRQQQPPPIGSNKEDLLGMIQHGARQVFEAATDKTAPGASTSLLLDTDIDALLAKGAEKTASLNAKFNNLGLDDLHNFTSDSSTYEWNGQNFAKRDATEGAFAWINPAKRERKEHTYSVDNYYKEVLAQKLAPEPKTAAGTAKPKPPKLYNVQDHQFFPPELVALLEREQLEYKKLTGYKYTLDDFGDTDDEFLEDAGETREQKRHASQRHVDEVVPLSAEEARRKDEMLATLFWLWSRRDFTNFIHGSAKFGRDNYTLIAREAMGANKSADEVERYLHQFWGGGFRQIEGYDKYILQIENSERKVAKLLNQQRLLALKMEAVRHPLEELRIHYPPNNSKRVYTKTEDRFILYCVHKLGLFADNLMERIKEEISESDLFRFDWFLLLRTPQELGRRVNTLLLAISREMDGPPKKRPKVRPAE